jgi:hypothetical protein
MKQNKQNKKILIKIQTCQGILKISRKKYAINQTLRLLSNVCDFQKES